MNEINKRLKDDGFDAPPPSRQHDSWTFYFQAPGGFTIEVLANKRPRGRPPKHARPISA